MLVRILILGGLAVGLWWLRRRQIAANAEPPAPFAPTHPPGGGVVLGASQPVEPMTPPAPTPPTVEQPPEAPQTTTLAVASDPPEVMHELAVGAPRNEKQAAAQPPVEAAAAAGEGTEVSDASAESTLMDQDSEAAAPETAGEVVADDDLQIIEGIGPKVATLMSAAGIASFAQLAATDPARLLEILREARIYTLNTTTWPEQARLAAEGRMDDLKAFQDRIRNGRVEA